jgi:hypothetical protein
MELFSFQSRKGVHMSAITVKKVCRRTSYVLQAVVDGKEINLELTHQPDPSFTPVVAPRAEGGFKVGYLVADDDPPNPFDTWEAEGHIYTIERNSTGGNHAKYQEARGMDSDWNVVRKPNPNAVLLDCYRHGGDCWAISGSEQSHAFPDQRWDVGHGVGVWVPDDCALGNIRARLPKGKKRDKHLFREALLKYCEGVLGTYNAYVNGDVWCTCIDEFDADLQVVNGECCGGIFGREYAEEELEMELNAETKTTGS